MMNRPNCPVIAIEEHYWDDELATHFSGPEAAKTGIIEKRLRDFGGDRIFSTPALLCCVMELGVGRILFAVDWPFVADSGPGVSWMDGVPLSAQDKVKVLGGNARTLPRL